MEDKQVFFINDCIDNVITAILYTELQHANYKLISFDNDSSTLGEPIIQALKNVRITVVVISKDFTKKKWPMIYLEYLLHTFNIMKETSSLTILPIFCGISPKDLVNPNNLHKWNEKWQYFSYKNLKRSKPLMFNIQVWPKALEMLNFFPGCAVPENLLSPSEYDNLKRWANSNFLRKHFGTQLVMRGYENKLNNYIKGDNSIAHEIDDRFNSIATAICELEDKERYPIVLGFYGLGGCGKTTICRIMEGYYKQDCSLAGSFCLELPSENVEEFIITELKKILKNLEGASDQVIRRICNINQAITIFSQRIRRYHVFIAIDNLMEWSKYHMLTILSSMSGGCMVMVTSPSEKLLKWLFCDIKEDFVYVGPTPGMNTTAAVEAFHNYAGTSVVDHDLVKHCFKGGAYHPLLIKEMAKQTIKLNSSAVANLEDLYATSIRNIEPHLKVNYEQIPSDQLRRIFLDVAIIFPSLQSFLEIRQGNRSQFQKHSMLGETLVKYFFQKDEYSCTWMNMLHKCKDVESMMSQFHRLEYFGMWRLKDGFVEIHELFENIAQRKATRSGYYLLENSPNAVHHKSSRVTRVIGSSGDCEFRHEFARQLMECRPRDHAEVIIHCERYLVDPKLLFGDRDKMNPSEEYENMLQHNNLTLDLNYWIGSQLRVLHLDCERIVTIQGLDSASNLVCVHLKNCYHLREIHGLNQLNALKELLICHSLDGFQNLLGSEVYRKNQYEHVTASEVNLTSPYLTRLFLTALLKLPLNLQIERLGSLKNLKELHLIGFEVLPDLRELRKLESLQLHYFESLKNIPDLSGQENLVHLSLSNCMELKSLPDFTQLKNLKELFLSFCQNLEALPQLKALNKLELLKLEVCESLLSLPDLSNLKSLKQLDLSFCQNLQVMPELKELSKLEILTLVSCGSLKSLPDLSDLKALREVQIAWCHLLEVKVDLNKLVKLEKLKLESCETLHPSCFRNLEELSNANQLNRLQVLDMESCSSLESVLDLSLLKNLKELHLSWNKHLEVLPELIELINLEVLKLKACESLRSLPDLSHLKNLKELDLSLCKNVEVLPELKPLSNLEILMFAACESLNSVPDLSHLENLKELDLSLCRNLELLPELNGHTKLQLLRLDGCESLKTLPELSYLINLEELHLSLCRNLEVLPELKRVQKLQILHLHGCECLKSLTELSYLTNLKELDLSWCKHLEVLPQFQGLSNLQILKLNGCECIRSLPVLSHVKNLKLLDSSSCIRLEVFPEINDLTKLEILKLSNCDSLKSIPDLSHLKNLKVLDISMCQQVMVLPELKELGKLEILKLERCESLKALPSVLHLKKLRELDLSWCQNLDVLEDMKEISNLQILRLEGWDSLKSLENLSHLTNLKELDLSACKCLELVLELKELKNLEKLKLQACQSLKCIKGLGHLEKLKEIDLSWCQLLETFPELKELSELKILKLKECSSLKSIPDLSHLRKLKVVDVSYCERLEDLPLVPNQCKLKTDGCKSLKQKHKYPIETLEIYMLY